MDQYLVSSVFVQDTERLEEAEEILKNKGLLDALMFLLQWDCPDEYELVDKVYGLDRWSIDHEGITYWVVNTPGVSIELYMEVGKGFAEEYKLI